MSLAQAEMKYILFFDAVVQEDDGQEIQRQGDRHTAVIGAKWREGEKSWLGVCGAPVFRFTYSYWRFGAPVQLS